MKWRSKIDIILFLVVAALVLTICKISYKRLIWMTEVVCWGQYLRPIEEVLADLEAEGFQLVDNTIDSCAGSMQAKKHFFATEVQCCFKVSDCKVQSVHSCIGGAFGSSHIPACEGSPCNSPTIRPMARDLKRHLDSNSCPPSTSCDAESDIPDEVAK